MKDDMEKRNPQYPKPYRGWGHSKSKMNEIRQNYSAQVENIDKLIGKIISYLKDKGQFDNTLFIISGDHGEMLRDHNHRNKRYPLHPSVNVPLGIFGPGIISQGLNHLPIETLDSVGTILDYAGIDIPIDMDTKSLRP